MTPSPVCSCNPASAINTHVQTFNIGTWQRRSRLKKVWKAGGRKLQFSDREDYTGAQKFNFIPKFPKMGNLQTNFFVFWKKIV